MLIDIRDLCKVYRMGDVEVHALRGVSFTAEKGEVCPAGWTAGDDSMKPDPKGSKEWFNKHM